MMSLEQALRQEGATGEELRVLMKSASDVRDRHYGKDITYSPKVFIPLTTMCRNDCKYCAFVKRPGDPGARYLSEDEVMAVVAAGENAGCREALFSLGERPENRYSEAAKALEVLGYSSTIEYLAAMCSATNEHSTLIPHVNAGALTYDELQRLKPLCGSMGMMLESVSVELMRPGGAHHACPDKVPKARLRTLEAAGELNIPFTTGMLIGIGETWSARVQTLIAIADIHRRFGHIQEVIIQNFKAKSGTEAAEWPEPSREDMLRTIGVARLLLPADVSLQAPPNLADDPLCYLDAGINDFGGISPVTLDFINPERKWPHIKKLGASLEQRGFQLVERLTMYPKFLSKSPMQVCGTAG